MPIRIDAQVIDTLLLGPVTRRRQLQNFPVLADVWTLFAEQPGRAHDLLLTPKFGYKAASIAKLLAEGAVDSPAPKESRRISYLQDLAVSRFFLEDLIWTAIPATDWWREVDKLWRDKSPGNQLPQLLRRQLSGCTEEETLGDNIGAERQPSENIRTIEALPTLTRQVVKLGLLLGVLRTAATLDASQCKKPPAEPLQTLAAAAEALDAARIVASGTEAIEMIQARALALKDNASRFGSIWLVTLNRRAMPAIERSVGAIKADAARLLFSIKSASVGWAVLDSGIDREHPAFRDHGASAAAAEDGSNGDEHPTRIKGTYDFGQIRSILSYDHLTEQPEPSDLAMELARTVAPLPTGEGSEADRLKTKAAEIQRLLHEAAVDMDEERPTNWEKLRPLVERRNPDRPDNPHGTHVAGIIGADWRDEEDSDVQKMIGVCPDIMLYDFRVLGATAEESEYAVIGALQFVRHLNLASGHRVIHGVNMSLSIPHSVRNYACGWTPVCVESEAVVSSGVVVVAAAGNRGYQKFRLADSSQFDSYAPSSITDPGNAENVITVGATHRYWPHTYGVSFFSSRGPTGDGRAKPDILAPGEKITSCVPNEGEDEMDGTSMAAPHVSGAAALLMARNEELKGQPARIKQILCESATDLKRERSFQGHGMLDVLRALQSI